MGSRRLVPRCLPISEKALSTDQSPVRPERPPLPTRLIVLSVVAISVAYVAWHLNRGWVPHDEGALAHAAQRVLLGELPHRDFDDIYTGGLALLDAAAFRLLGTTLWSMRLALLAVFIVWVPIVFYVASRFVRARVAAGVTLLAVVWSIPNYPAPMPSWFNLFFATFGVAAMLRFLEDRRQRWLVLAGMMGGLSFLIKVVGLYYVAGVLLFLVHLANASSRDAAGLDDRRGTGYIVFVAASLALFVMALLAVLHARLAPPELIQFVLPAALISVLLVRNEWTSPVGGSWVRLTSLARLLGPFVLGVLLPVALYLLPYARSGALGAFMHGVFVLPIKRLGHATFALPLATLLAIIPAAIVALVVAGPGGRERRAAFGRRETILLALALAVILVASGSVGLIYRFVLFTLRGLVPVIAIAAVTLLLRDHATDPAAQQRRARLMLMLCVTAVCMLVQYPFTVAIYFCYVAPLVALTATAFLAYLNRPVSPMLPALGIAFCAAFAVFRLNDSPLNDMDRQFESYPEVRRLALDRAGLEVPLWMAGQYEATVGFVREHAHGRYIWASPDVPQIYFLTGYDNPTRSLFEFFDDTTGRATRILRALDEHHVNLIVLNISPQFSPRIPLEFYRQLARRYPNSALVEPYLIKWRE